jgi:Mg-chelatase subunit ChlD
MTMGKSSLVSLLAFAAVASSASEQPIAEVEPLDIRRVEHVYVDDVHPGVGGGRVVDLYFRALTGLRQPVDNLRLVDVEVREDLGKVSPDDILSMMTLEEAGLGVTCVLALDTSRTMIGKPFERARSAAVGFLDRLGSGDTVAIVAFASTVDVVASFTDSLPSARDRLSAMGVDQNAMSTVLYDGVHQAVQLARYGFDLPRRVFVIVFSDGRDGGSKRSLDEVIQLAKGGEGEPRIPVFTVGYAGRGGGGLEVLEKLAAESSGNFSRATQLKEFYDETLQQMRRSYVLKYESDMDGTEHLVEVAVEGKPDSRSATYPKIEQGLWRWPLAAGMAIIVLLLARALMGTRSAGTLRVVHGALEEERFTLHRGRTRIGSLADNDVVIDAEVVSRYHAEIHASRNQIEIRDLQSTNGTLVNGVPIESSPLEPGDRVRIGEVEMVFER